MKIWIARLRLVMQDEGMPSIDFSIEESISEYSFNKNAKRYEESSKFYIVNSVPTSMEIKYIYSGLVVEQGFEKKPLQEETEKKMKEYLIRFLERRHQEITEIHNKKIELLKRV